MKRILLSFLFLILFANKSLAEPVATASAFGIATNATSVTSGSFTPSGSNKVLIVYGYWFLTTGPLTNVVCNGVTATMFDAASSFPAWNGVFYIINPASVSQTCTMSFGGTEDALGIAVQAISDAHQTTPIRSSTTQSSLSSSFNINVTSQSNDLVLGGAFFDAPSAGAMSGGTVVYSDAQINAAKITGMLNRASGASTVNFTWNCCGRTWAFVGVSIAPPAAAPPSPGGSVRRRGM